MRWDLPHAVTGSQSFPAPSDLEVTRRVFDLLVQGPQSWLSLSRLSGGTDFQLINALSRLPMLQDRPLGVFAIDGKALLKRIFERTEEVLGQPEEESFKRVGL